MTININLETRLRILMTAALLALSGCATLPEDLGRSDVDKLVADRGLATETVDRASLLASLTDAPLTARSAIRVALINNPSLRANYAELGFAAADVYQASRVRNPIFSASILNSNQLGKAIR